jgi:localization factor PodJL
MHNLAVLYVSGLLDGAPDMTKAVVWFKKAANLGVKDSQVNFGILSAQGLGVTKDLSEAYKWFAIAARGGDTDAATKRDSLTNSLRPEQISAARGAAEIWTPSKLEPDANTPSILPEWKTESAGQAALGERGLIARTQQLLARRGFDPGPADGLMGDRTREAIRLFEKQSGMPAHGEVTAELLKRLRDGSA